MHKIERLIQTLAPKGVEFRKLGEVCDFQKGKSITKKAVTFGKVPVISGGRQPAYYHNEANRSGETIAISSSGVYAGYVSYWDIPVFLADSFSVSPKQKTLMPKYLFHYLTTQQDAIHATKSTGGIPHVYSKDLQNFLIPIPPLEIQQEIVKILDAFTELNTELKARKKQYQYYQNMLLDFNDINQNHKDAKERLAQKTYPKRLKTLLQTLAPKGVEFRKLGEVINILKGKQLNKELLLDYGEYPVMNGGIHASGYWNEYNTDYPKIIISQGGASAGYVNYMTSKFWAGAHCYAIELNSEKLNYKFLYYFLKNSQTILMKSQFGAGIPALNKADIETLTIPIPPLEIQQEIVKILDQFSLLTTDLLAGIPAEIKARKKQYEYYREKLLTFKPLTPNKEVKKCQKRFYNQ
ncbi:restriction endonuclease subunit S [Helicobacter pylori]|uniref:restriction endonuclease subunit S n=1 Tax=Helicobacter pylori TaxID=210 RepID=UPI0035A8D4ED